MFKQSHKRESLRADHMETWMKKAFCNGGTFMTSHKVRRFCPFQWLWTKIQY